MTSWQRSMDSLLGLALGLLLAGFMNDGTRLLAASAALVGTFVCILIVRRRKAAAISA